MNLLAVCVLAAQASVWTVSPPAPSVGDTVRITLRLRAEPETHTHALPLASNELYVSLADPIAAYSEGYIVIRYQLAFFETGYHAVEMPNIELTTRDGRVDVVEGGTAWVQVASVLPPEDSLPPPQPSVGPISRVQRSGTPAVILVAMTAMCLVGWAIWRRRTLPRPVWSGVAPEPVRAPLQQWMMAGESKAVVGAVTDRLRHLIQSELPAAGRHLTTEECLKVIQEYRPEWPRRDIGEMLRSLDRAQYAPAAPSDVALLVDQVEGLIAVLHEGSSQEAGE